MTDWVDVVAINALAAGENIVVDVDGCAVAVFNIGGEFYAIEDVCTHDGAEIASGLLVGDEIICPRHGARFCVKTGAVKSPPAYSNIDCFPVRIVEGRLQVRDNRWD
ncbi:MAG: non-heme iron oxygenase ferredoxin subunit [Methylococcaceae bacterium]|jgi:3-phenylpropionate/trans-cinnamate dioxygenase ferredoxin subunit